MGVWPSWLRASSLSWASVVWHGDEAWLLMGLCRPNLVTDPEWIMQIRLE